mgnify:CR=1 FL=1
MSFPVAFQSAVFYFVACTPCAQVRHRQKSKTKAKKEREEKAKIVTEQPHLYQHPSPFNTNPYWQEEIDIGPSLPKKVASKNSSQRGLSSSGKDSDAPSVSSRTNVGDSRTHFGDSVTVIPEDDALSDDWNRRKGYQREDEELWGQWSGHKIIDAFSKARDSAGRFVETTLGLEKEVTDQERRDFYFSPKNPPINEYHPPVVSSKAPHASAHQWMLQPPPPAKVMDGKVPVGRAMSSASKSSGRSREDVHLGRLVQERLVLERMRREKENNPSETELIESLFATRDSRSLSLGRSRSLSLDGTPEDFHYSSKRRSRLQPVARPPGADSDDSDLEHDYAMPMPRPLSTSTNGHAAQRPKLETIESQEADGMYLTTPKPHRRSTRRRKRISGTASPVGDDSD